MTTEHTPMTRISIDDFANLTGVETYLTGARLDRMAVRNFLGPSGRKMYFGAFAVDDGIVAYRNEKAQERAFNRKNSLARGDVS